MRHVQGAFFFLPDLLGFDTNSKPHTFSVRVTRETAPEVIDKLQRRKLELEVEIHALERKGPGLEG